MVKVLFVCMGNICRSPTAQGVFERLVHDAGLRDRVHTDSAGTHAYHIGEPPDARSQAAAAVRGYDLSTQRARRVEHADFQDFDYVLVMDRDNLHNIQVLCPPDQIHKVSLFLDFAPHLEEAEVPDPYYGGASGFERVLDMVEAASRGLLQAIQTRL